jgi:hypothetical protein
LHADADERGKDDVRIGPALTKHERTDHRELPSVSA